MQTTSEIHLESWTPSSWRDRPIAQHPPYRDPAKVTEVTSRLRTRPSLVTSGEVERLKEKLAAAQAGEAFVLHGGDCAERFADCERAPILAKLRILLQMSLVLSHGARRPIVRIGRIAGQFAKPRSNPTETVDGIVLPTYRGDLVNGEAATPESREPDPARMLEAHASAASALNFIRALVEGGFADLRHADHWSLSQLPDSPERTAFQGVVDRIRDAIDLLECLGALDKGDLARAEIFSSHEGLILPYEEAQTIRPARRTRHYNLGAHFLWIGDRTRQLDGAHVEFFRGIANPIGLKVGPSLKPAELSALVERLNPANEPGKLTLISRYGASQIERHLPAHIRAVRAAGARVLWSCDPMHGNTLASSAGVKTRSFETILAEIRAAFAIHRAEGSQLGGVHFEMTGENVTECIGGGQRLSEQDLLRNYATGCDPRLNYTQSLEMAFYIGRILAEVGHARGRLAA